MDRIFKFSSETNVTINTKLKTWFRFDKKKHAYI